MKDNLRQSMALLHTWAGLLPGWLLFVVFLFGSAAFFQQEISRWMRPELGAAGVQPAALVAADARLRDKMGAESWGLLIPPARGGAPLTLIWTMPEGHAEPSGRLTLDPATGNVIQVRETRGGDFLYRMHFDLHYLPVTWARMGVCIASLAMLVTLLTGVVAHKKIFADFFTARLGKGQRSWLDLHNMAGVFALPFHVMITYTGLVTFLFTLMPWAISANFANRSDFSDLLYPQPEVSRSGTVAPVLPLTQLVSEGEAIWGDVAPRYIVIRNPGDSYAVAQIYPGYETLGGQHPVLTLSAVTGERLPPYGSTGAGRATERVMIDLHAGRFSGAGLRWLYFLSGVAGTGMIATGLILWTVKRRARLSDPQRPYFGFRLVERLNIGVMAGASAGVAAYFLANRLLPAGMAHRADWEINGLFMVWGAVWLWSLMRPAKQAWVEAMCMCAALYAVVPVVNAATTSRGLVVSLWAKDWVYVGFDLTLIVCAAIFAFAAHKVAHQIPRSTKAVA